jgi:tubulin beta
MKHRLNYDLITHITRSINVDLEPGTLDHIKSGPMGKLYHPSNFIAGEVRK